MAMEEIGFFKNLFISGLDRVEIIVIKTQTKRIIFFYCALKFHLQTAILYRKKEKV